tara:strand:- start:11141 stop:11485 length:345 start_codon:yes stop_codon:yes gene_type:complete
MQKIIKLNSLLYKSNNFNYGQLLLNKNIILTVRSDLLNKNIYFKKIKKLEKLLILYNKKIISYTTLNFLVKKNNKIINTKSNYSFLKILTELSWESGILIRNKEKINNITFSKN